MKNVTRFVTMVALLAFAAAPVFAGGEQEGTDQTAADGGMEQARLELYLPGERKPDADRVLTEIQNETAENLNVELDFTWIPWGDYESRINVINAAGESYEAHFDADWLAWGTLAPRGGLADISELLPEYAPTLADRYTERQLRAATVDGSLTALPWLYPGSQRRATLVREDLRNKYDVPEISSYEDLEVYLEAIKENEPDLIPFVPQANDTLIMFADNYGYAMLHTSLQVVYKWDDPDMELMLWEQTPEFREAVSMMRRWYEEGYLPRDLLSMQADPQALFVNGRSAARVHLKEGEIQNKLELQANIPNGDVRAFNLYPEKTAHLSPPMNNAIAFNANADQLPRTLQFLEWVHAEQENYDLLVQGIEGEHWIDAGSGQMSYPEGVDTTNHPYQNWQGEWGFWDIQYERFPLSFPETYREDYIADVNMNTQYWPHLGFVPSLEDVRTEVAQRQAVYDETGHALMFGVISADNIDSYIEQQRNVGSEELLAELQRQLDEWRASQ